MHEAPTCPARLTHEPSPSANHARAGHPIADITPDNIDSKKLKPTAPNTQTTDNDRPTAEPTAAKRRKRRRRRKIDESSENEPPKRSKNKEKENDSRASLTNSSTSEARGHSPKPSEDPLVKPPSVISAADETSETPEPVPTIRSSNEEVQVCDIMSLTLQYS